MNKIASLATVCGLLISVLSGGCSQRSVSDLPQPHPHRRPLTQTIDGYHVRLVVDRSLGKMWLVFEDISEEPVRAMRPRDISAKAVMPDGKKIDVGFHPVPPPFEKYHRLRKHHKRRLVSLFAAKANWIKTINRFDLAVKFIYSGRHYPLIFRYGSSQNQ